MTHADGTGRLQSVDKVVTPRYYQLIETFRKKTGVPILLNTSFNENEPIVNSPHDALECYLRTEYGYAGTGKIVLLRGEWVQYEDLNNSLLLIIVQLLLGILLACVARSTISQY